MTTRAPMSATPQARGGGYAAAGASVSAFETVLAWGARPGLVAGLVLATRIATIAVLYALTQGAEVTGDASRFWGMANDPFQLLVGNTTANGQYPPFLPLVLAAVFKPLQWALPDFAAIRLAYSLFEAVAAWFTVAAVAGSRLTARQQGWVGWVLVLMPSQAMTSAVMAQDETLGTLFLAAALWLVSQHRYRDALLTLGLATATSKVFFILPLGLLGLFAPWSNVFVRALVGGAPVLLGYGWMLAAAKLTGHPPPLSGFVPDIWFSCSNWLLVFDIHPMKDAVMYRLSVYLSVVAVAIPTGLYAWLRRPFTMERFATLSAAALAMAFAFFYHVNAEYYAMLIPALVIAFPGFRGALGVATTTSLTWVPNFIYAARIIEGIGGNPERVSYASLVTQLWGPYGYLVHNISLLLTMGAMLWLAWDGTRRVAQEPWA